MNSYKFKIWKDDTDEIKEVLIIAENEDEAWGKLTTSVLPFRLNEWNYDCIDNKEYDAILY